MPPADRGAAIIEPMATTDHPGAGIVRASWICTAALTLSAGLALALPDTFRPVSVAVDLALFAVGCVTFLWAYAIAVQRSRTDAIGIGGLYFLAGPTAPKPVKLHLLGSLAIQVVVAVGAAALRPFTVMAFTILAPMAGLGLAGLWGARYGTFGPRAAEPTLATTGAVTDEPADAEVTEVTELAEVMPTEPPPVGQNESHG